MLKDLGVHAVFDILVGLPLEKEEQLRESLDLLLQLPAPFGLNVWPLIYYRNYKLTNMLNQTNMPVPGTGKRRKCRNLLTRNPICVSGSPSCVWCAMQRFPRKSGRWWIIRHSGGSYTHRDSRTCPLGGFVENTVFTHKDSMMQQLQNENALLRAQLDNVQNGNSSRYNQLWINVGRNYK